MRVFNYDPVRLRQTLRQNGYVHARQILTPEFLDYLRGFLAESLETSAHESADWRIAGKKRQFVFDFPSTAAAEEFRAGMAALTGIPQDDFTISERHLKLYTEDADPYPNPHKDRSASHYSIGLPVALPEGSSVVMFPEMDPGPNPEPRAVFLSEPDPEARRAIYDSPGAHVLNEKVGDLIVFLGSALYHERIRGAGTAVLYVKVNGEGLDPLGENIYRAPAMLHS